MSNETYDASSITVLEGLQAVRLRPGMYVGSVGPSGVRQLLWEAVSNTLDEHLAGHASELQIGYRGGWFEVCDNGRGIPLRALPTLFTTLHAGSTLDQHAPHVHVGSFGLGLPVLNALSDELVVDVRRDGNHHRQVFVGQAPRDIQRIGSTTETGTTVRFRPDVSVFGAIGWPPGVWDRLHELAFLHPELTVRCQGVNLSEPGGILDLARQRSEGPLTAEAVLHHEDERLRLSVAAVWGARKSGLFYLNKARVEGGALVDQVLSVVEGQAVTVVIDAVALEPQFAGPTRGWAAGPIPSKEALRRLQQTLEDALP